MEATSPAPFPTWRSSCAATASSFPASAATRCAASTPAKRKSPAAPLDTLWPESIATHVLQTVRRILKTRKTAQQRYQDGELKLEMRFQVQGFDRVLVVCRDLGAGATANDSGLYPQGASAMLPHRDGFEKSLRMALDMAALREDTVGVALIHIGGYVTYQRVFDSALANRLLESAAKRDRREPARRRAPTCRASRAFPTTSSAWC